MQISSGGTAQSCSNGENTHTTFDLTKGVGVFLGLFKSVKLSEEAKKATSIFDFAVSDIWGRSNVSLSSYSGKRGYLVVNVASKCGLTETNYEELNELYSKYKDSLEILAFPCNNFLNQEPGSGSEISAVIQSKGIKFPVFGKLECENRDLTHPLYQYLKLALKATSGWLGTSIKWNFTKFLCDSNGVPIKRYSPKQNPKSFEDDLNALLNQS
jgi:glutathione peroxidase